MKAKGFARSVDGENMTMTMTRFEINNALDTRFAVYNDRGIPPGFDEYGEVVREAYFRRDGQVHRVVVSRTTFDGECSLGEQEAFSVYETEIVGPWHAA
jgi:hypothetical protein